jgi:hypothetical protein
MASPGDDGGITLQWIAGTVITLFMGVYGTMIFRLWTRVEGMQAELGRAAETILLREQDRDRLSARASEAMLLREQERDRLMREQMQRLGDMISQERDRNAAAIDRLREVLEEDRRLAATDRSNIAGTMVTRMELDRQLENRFGPAPRGRAGTAD